MACTQELCEHGGSHVSSYYSRQVRQGIVLSENQTKPKFDLDVFQDFIWHIKKPKKMNADGSNNAVAHIAVALIESTSESCLICGDNHD